MPNPNAIAALATLALLSVDVVLLGDSREPPTEFRIFRAGANETTKGVFLFDEESQKSVMAAFARHGADVPIDYEHKMLDWLAPASDMVAAGWFTPEVRDGDLWATNVRWTNKAAAHLREGEWRYYSPAFTTGDDGRILELINVALTNLPATHQLEALVAASARALSAQTNPASPEKGTPTMKNVLIALGLSESASEADAIVALSRLRDATAQDKQAMAQVLSIVGAKSSDEAVGKVAGLRDEAAKVAELSTENKKLTDGLRKKEVEAIVGEKVTAGFLMPANRDFAITLGMESPKAFDAYLATLTSQVTVNTSGGKDKPAKAKASVAKLSKDELKIAEAFGRTPAEFAKNKTVELDAYGRPVSSDDEPESDTDDEEEVALWPSRLSSAKPSRWAMSASPTSTISRSSAAPSCSPARSS